MDLTEAAKKEAVGPKYSMPAMTRARDRTVEAVGRIAEGVRPGMSEPQACVLAAGVLAAMGMDRLWHKTLVRIGENTLKTFHEPSDPGVALGELDVFFVDLGVVWDGHEGDAGDTFVVGEDAQMHACGAAARTLWKEVADRWRTDQLSGEALYDFAAEAAHETGWRLNLEIRGHRVCDFPHAIYRAGALGDFALCPSTGLWMLEIQIAHPSLPYGAFFEDLLVLET